MINVLKSAPESLLSADKEVHRRALGQYTDLGVPMPEMYNAIKVDLTRHVRDLIPIIQDEVAYAFNHNLHFEETEEWQEVTAFVLIKHVVTIVNSVVFVGRRLSRDRNWQELAYKYSDDLRAAFDALNEWPVWLRPFVHPWILKRIGFTGRRRTVAAMLNPLLHDQNSGPSDDPTLLKWIRKRLGFQRSNDTALLARMELRAILASSDTVSQALTNAVFDLAAMPEHIEPMRDEVASLVSQAKNGAWDMTMVRNMGKVDSLLRESTRVYAPFLGQYTEIAGYEYSEGKLTSTTQLQWAVLRPRNFRLTTGILFLRTPPCILTCITPTGLVKSAWMRSTMVFVTVGCVRKRTCQTNALLQLRARTIYHSATEVTPAQDVSTP